MKKLIPVFLFLIAFSSLLQAQDTLPKFNVTNVGSNRIVIGWTNTFETIKQISIQRSFDSLTGYKTILTVPDPTTPQNGYVDAKAVNDHMFYRLYILLDKGMYIFSAAKKPKLDTARKIVGTNGGNGRYLDSLKRIDPFGSRLDSMAIDSTAVPSVKPKIKTPSYVPSKYVFTNKDGYVKIKLPDEEKPKKYSIKFFEEDNTFLFELKELKQKEVKLDKTAFYHAGWFRFELYEDDKLLEKHKFYLDKDF
jgi:hypothetical protein